MGFMDNAKFTYAWGKIKEYIGERYVGKETGKGLSTNDFTTVEKDKLANLPTQTDLATSLAGKQNTLTAGANITISSDTISASVPQATETTFGGFKAQARTTESNEVKIDTTTGKLYALAPDLANIPTATTSVKGGIKVGSGLTMTDETMSVDTSVIATVAQVNALDIPTPAEITAITDDITALETAVDSKADLVGGKIPAAQLPSFVDDVIEVATEADLPTTGESGKIYITADDNVTHRWGGSSYVAIGSSLALGETAETAYRGDRGLIAYNHSQLTTGNPHSVTKADVGLSNVDNTSDLNKPVSTAVNTKFGDYWAIADLQPMTEAEIDAIIV